MLAARRSGLLREWWSDMAIEGVDYAWARPDPAGLYRAGKRFAARYLAGSAGKYITAPERKALHAAGLDVVLIWELAAGAAAGGYGVGRDHGQRAAAAVTAIGAPDTAAVYFAVDFEANTTSELAQVREYFRGIISVWPKARTGIYGGRAVIAAAKAGGWCTYRWQTYAWSKVDGKTSWVPGNHLEQYNNGEMVAGGEVDLNRATTAQYGQWAAKSTEEDEMTPDEHGAVIFARDFWTRGGTSSGVVVPGTKSNAGIAKIDYIMQTVTAMAKQSGMSPEQLDEIAQAAREGAAAGVEEAAPDVVDEAELARQILAQLPPDLARQVLDEAAARLAAS